ncbi:hypothetical protein D3C84_1192170 [compost metagenome]
MRTSGSSEYLLNNSSVSVRYQVPFVNRITGRPFSSSIVIGPRSVTNWLRGITSTRWSSNSGTQ